MKSALFGGEPLLLRGAVLLMVGFNALFLTTNGLFMLAEPEAWYNLVQGVTQTGFFNQHFIRDIGIIQLFLGLAFALGMMWPARRSLLWTVATLWLGAHACLHVWEVAIGICAPFTLLRDFPAVTMPALFGALLCWWALRAQSGTRLACPPKAARA